MRRVLISLLLLITTVSLVLAIVPQRAQGDEITLSFALWDENQKPTMQKIVDAFNASHEGVKVVIELTPWTNYWMKLDAAAGAEQAPDIFWMNVYLPKYVKGNVVLPLDEYIKRDNIDLKHCLINTMFPIRKRDGHGMICEISLLSSEMV